MTKTKIEIAISSEKSTTDKGNLLENLCGEIVQCLGYSIENTNVGLSGMEIDVIAKQEKSEEKVYIECKAHRNNIGADILNSLMGKVAFKEVKAGWLFYTSILSKGAKGIIEELTQKNKTKFLTYGPSDIIDLLMKNKSIISSSSLKKPDEYSYSDTDYLIITEHGKFWVSPINSSGVEEAVITFNGSSGNIISDEKLLKTLSQTDTSLKDLNWLPSIKIVKKIEEAISEQKENIVTVKYGDEWADYRPSRPSDFVGREGTIKEIFDFLDDVRNGHIETRILGLSAPSGWGKSSTIVKLIDKSRNKRNKKNYYVYGVDTRAATSKRYAELSLFKCIEKAQKEGFIPTIDKLQLGNSEYILDNESLKPTLNYLKENNKVILLYFDQYEELFLKEELFDLFHKFSALINSVDSKQENLVIGFAWKTDNNIPQDHPAYSLWHKFSDRRKEIKLDLFSKKEISSTITKLSKQIEQKIDVKLRRYLSDHCQGYPWFLKKLCIHVYNLLKNGKKQSEILEEKLNIKSLFDEDMNSLNESERKCIHFVAEKSPASIIELNETYGNQAVNDLVSKRIFVKSGPNVSLYWDIFRDYIKTGKIPVIWETYRFSSHVSTYYNAIQKLLDGDKTVKCLASELNMSEGSTENIARDLIMIGNAKRENGVLSLLQNTEKEVVNTMRLFCSDHIFYNELRKEASLNNGFVTDRSASNILENTYKTDFVKDTWKVYSNKLLSWFEALQLINIGSGRISLNQERSKNIILAKTGKKRNNKQSFKAGAPYQKIIEVINSIGIGKSSEKDLSIKGYRNAISMLKKFDLIEKEKGGYVLSKGNIGQTVSSLKDYIRESNEFKIIEDMAIKNIELTGANIGAQINSQLNNGKWKKTSEIRYGNDLKKWYKEVSSN